MIDAGAGREARSRAALLFLVPLLTYLASYAYLAWYHGSASLWSIPVHESEQYGLLRTSLYAPHFLGHVPVDTVLACWFVGSYLMLVGPPGVRRGPMGTRSLAVLLCAFLALCLALSLAAFGVEDTVAYILQRRQRAGGYAVGGSWNLHLPSTVLMLLLIPPYLAAAAHLLRLPLRPGAAGRGLLCAGAGLVVAMTLAVNLRTPAPLVGLWSDPRYMAHSVRELATFPLTYLPLPLASFHWIARRPDARTPADTYGPALLACAALLAVFLVGFGHQVRVSLDAGIPAMAQAPAFARGGSLSVPYLLNSHYFEHFLDSIYFWLLSLWLYARAADQA